MDTSLIIGADIGGSHITAALVSVAKREVINDSTKRQRINAKGESTEIIKAWAECIGSLIAHIPGSDIKVGIAMPGPFDYEKGISYIKGLDKYESLYNLNVKSLLSDALHIPSHNILMKNDAACFLQGEVFAGAGRGYKNAIGITLGTGAGSATYHNGVAEDANLGPSPFLDSIADNYLSTRWFVKQYTEQSGKPIANVKEMVALYDSDPLVKNIFTQFSVNLALFLRDFIQKENPEVIILGGNIALCSDYFLADVERKLKEFSFNVPIKLAALGEEAIILGAASLFENTVRSQ